MRTKEVTDFIQDNADLFWFIPDDRKAFVSDECLVETVLNHGSMAAVIRLIKLLGVDHVARIFAATIKRSERRKNHYNELSRDYFSKVFKRYAPRHFDG